MHDMNAAESDAVESIVPERFPSLEDSAAKALGTHAALELASGGTGIYEPVVLPQSGFVLDIIVPTVRAVKDAVCREKMDDPSKFHSLFRLMIGLGLSQRRISEELGIKHYTISRYANAAAAPEEPYKRRGILMETLRMLETDLNKGELPCLTPFQDNVAAVEQGQAS